MLFRVRSGREGVPKIRVLRWTRIMGRLLAALLLMADTLPALAATRRAVIVGINDYDPPYALKGCVNDARALADVLRTYGFPDRNIKFVLNQEATRQGILSALREAREQVKKGDLFLFAYSGHGTLFPDEFSEDVDEQQELTPNAAGFGGGAMKRGRYDSALCPFDVHRPSTSGKPWQNLILDDELFALFSGFTRKGCMVVVLSDSCHSGSLGRGLDVVPRSMPLSAALTVPVEKLKAPPRTRGIGNGVPRTLDGLYLTLTASSDVQTAGEDPSIRRGIFTANLETALKSTAKSDRLPSYRMLFESVRSLVLQRTSGTQEPQLDARFFGGDLEAPAFSLPAVAPGAPVAGTRLRVVVKVTDEGGRPLDGASFCVFRAGVQPPAGAIRTADTMLLGRTDPRGFFDSSATGASVPPGSYRMKVVRNGYVSVDGMREIRPEPATPGVAVLAFKLVKE